MCLLAFCATPSRNSVSASVERQTARSRQSSDLLTTNLCPSLTGDFWITCLFFLGLTTSDARLWFSPRPVELLATGVPDRTAHRPRPEFSIRTACKYPGQVKWEESRHVKTRCDSQEVIQGVRSSEVRTPWAAAGAGDHHASEVAGRVVRRPAGRDECQQLGAAASHGRPCCDRRHPGSDTTWGRPQRGGDTTTTDLAPMTTTGCGPRSPTASARTSPSSAAPESTTPGWPSRKPPATWHHDHSRRRADRRRSPGAGRRSGRASRYDGCQRSGREGRQANPTIHARFVRRLKGTHHWI